MKLAWRIAAGAAFVAAVSTAARAQEAGKHSGWFFKTPIFILQPGAVTSNIFDRPDDVKVRTDFLFRFLTAIPTIIPRTAIVAIVQWTPFNRETLADGTRFTHNSPALVYGPVVNVINTRWFGFDADVLGAYGPRAESSDKADYTHKLVLEGDFSLKVGQAMMPSVSYFKDLALYAFLAYTATGLPSGAARWAVLYGLSLPIAR